MEDLSYLTTEYARSKMIEEYNNKSKQKEIVMKRQFFIAGVQFRPRPKIDAAAKQMEVGSGLLLKPEPTNKFDPNAVQIIFKGVAGEREPIFLGYVPKKFSSEVTALLSIDAPIVCVVDEVNPAAKTYEMFKVTISIPIEEGDNEDGLEDDGGHRQ
jgi:hypothetical protein